MNGKFTTDPISQSLNNVPLGFWPTSGDPLISATYGVSATIKPQTTLFDLRRYVYPELADYTMGDFLQDICKIFNLKYEEPQPQNPSNLIQLKSFENYIRDNISKYGIKDLSDIITADKMKINKTQYGLISLKRAQQEGDLNDLFYKNDIEKTGYGDYYNEFLSYSNNDKKLNIETKLSYGVSNYLMTSYGERSYYTLGTGSPDSYSDIFAYGFTYQRKNNKPIQVHTALTYNDYNLSKTPLVDQLYAVRDYDIKKTKIKPFILYNQRDARIYTIISGYDAPSNTTYSTTYSTYQIQTGGNTIMPYDQVNNCGLFPNLTNYDGSNRSIIFDNSNGNLQLDAASQSGYVAWYEQEIDNINGLFIIDTEVNMKLAEFNEFTFAQLWKLKIQGEYKLFRINKMMDFTLNDDSSTKVQLVEIPNASKWIGLTQSYQSVDFGPSGI